MATIHLKTWPEQFQAIVDGIKKFEFRLNDRCFLVGDTLHLREWDPAKKDYTGRSQDVLVTYILYGGQFEVPENCVVMSVEKVE